MVGLGLLFLSYFFLIFDISVEGPGQSRIVNLGKTNDRTTGATVGAAILIGGAILMASRGHGQPRPVAPSPPTAPHWFILPIQLALTYTPTNKVASTSYALWSRSLQQYMIQQGRVMSFTKSQLDWGYSYDLPPTQFVEAVDYIEAYRCYRKQVNGLGSRIQKLLD